MSYRTVLLHCLMQSEMLFCMFRPEIPCLSQYSFYAFNFSPPHLFPFTPEQFSTGGINTSPARLSFAIFSSRWVQRIWSCILAIRGVLLLNECTDTSSSWCRKIFIHLPLNDLWVQDPEASSTLQAQLEWKENGFSQVAPQHTVQLQAHMQCRTQHLVFSCSAWQKVAGPQKVFRIWTPTHSKRFLFLSRFWKLVHSFWTGLNSFSYFLYLKMSIPQPSLCLLLNSEGSWNPLGGMIITLIDSKDVVWIC